MAEIVEINYVCSKYIGYDFFLNYISNHLSIEYYDKKIEVMDNWQYENLYELDIKANIEEIVNEKIICLTAKVDGGYIGLNIEKIDDVYCYNLWFNHVKYEELNEYKNLIKQFMIFFIQKLDKKNAFCTIGKELIFEYQKDKDKMFDNSHNVDIWINIEMKNSLVKNRYSKSYMDKIPILIRKNIF